MTEQTEPGAAAVVPATPAVKDQAPAGTATVNPVEAVEKAALKDQLVEDSSFLDTLTPEQRRSAEAWNKSQRSKAVNDALKTKTEKGEYLTSEQVEDKMRRMFTEANERAELRIRAREGFYRNLAENGIVPGTPDEELFNKELQTGIYNMEKLGEKAVVERIAKAAGAGRHKVASAPEQRSTVLGTSGVSLKDLGEKADGKHPTGSAVIDDARAMLANLKPQ